jgi:hypothetical protein
MKGPEKSPGTFHVLAPDDLWYPVHTNTDKLTYAVTMDLPEQYQLRDPGIRKRHRWHWGAEKPVDSIVMPLLEESGKGR